MNDAINWVQANPWTAFSIVVYIIANLSPRPHPENRKGWEKTFWTIIDRLCVLTVSKVPGRLKMFLMASPIPDASGKSEKDKKE